MTPVGVMLLALLVVAAAGIASLAARALKIPYTVALVIVGLCIGLLHRPPSVFVPSVVIAIFLPALLFAAAWEMDQALLVRRWLPIAALATAGVAIGVAVTYGILTVGAGVAGGLALMFGAAVAATDPVAVIALFRELRVDRSIATIVEGESLFNDGVAVVLVRSLTAGVAAGAGGALADPASIATSAVLLTLGGALLGASIGFVAAHAVGGRGWTTKPGGRHGVATASGAIALTGVAAYGSYAVAELAHVSGIVAVIAAGITCAAVRGSAAWPAKATEAADRFWERAALVANSILFVLVGLTIDLRSLFGLGAICAWSIAAVVVARAVAVYCLCALLRAAGDALSVARQHIIALGGLRGALSMALVLGLPENFPERSTLIGMVYAVVAFTLVIQGLSLRPAIVALGVQGRELEPAGPKHHAQGHQ